MELSIDDQVAVDQLNTRYGQTTDSGDGPGFADCFTADGVFASSTRGEITGRDALIEFAQQTGARPGAATRTHWISPALLKTTGEAVSATCNALVVEAGGNPAIVASVRYDDLLEKTVEGWRIKRRTVVTHPRVHEPADPNRAAVEKFLDALVRQDVDAVVAVHTEDAVLEFPYAPPGFPRRVEGHDAIRAFEAPITDSVESSSFHDLVVRPVAGANQAVATYRGEVKLRNGRDYNNQYCLVIDFKDGRFHRVTEYFNPVVIVESGLIEDHQ